MWQRAEWNAVLEGLVLRWEVLLDLIVLTDGMSLGLRRMALVLIGGAKMGVQVYCKC